MKVAGLSIEGPLIRVSIGVRRLREVTCLEADDLMLPEGGEEEHTSFLNRTLAEWKAEFGIKGVVFGLGLGAFTHSFIELPVTSAKEIRGALEFELEKHLPLPPEEYIYDFVTVESTGSTSRNLVLSVRKEKLRWLTACLRNTGIRLMGVRCPALEALNELLASEAKGDVLFLYPSDQAYCILGVTQGKPDLIKTVYSLEEARSMLESLVESYPGGIFSSGLQDSPALEKLGVRHVSLAPASLLAASALRKRSLDMNFAPAEEAAGMFDCFNRMIAGIALAAVALLFLTPLVSYFKDYAALRSVNNRLEEIKTTSSGLLKTRNELEATQEKRRFLRRFKSRSNLYIEVIRHMSEILPKSAWLTSLSADEKGRIEIEGYARRTAELIGPLENSPLFRNVEFSSPVNVRGGIEKFSIKMEVEQ